MASDPRLPTVWLVGDSLTSVKRVSSYPETGWGMPFASFFRPGVAVENRAVNGQSTSRFREEGHWARVLGALNPGDWLLIQFGHNDESHRRWRTTPDEFEGNLRRYVAEAVALGVLVVLLTPVTRRRFTDDGDVPETHPYASIVEAVAADLAVPSLDIDRRSRHLLRRLGPEVSKLAFLHLAPGEHPNHPDGVEDDTHLSELGARLVAQEVLAALWDADLELVDLVVASEA